MINETINKITNLRIKSGISARKLSLSLGRSDNYITLLENKKTFLPPLETLLEIIALCGSTPQEFFADPNILAFYSDKDTIELIKNNKDLLELWKTATPEKKAAAIAVLKIK
ncbi:MAG: helix-turn-helix domain-containing protein [Firmicutes bacterium]|nr:helix-turn-helix domain-containing protein [Bacillota bacterium]